MSESQVPTPSAPSGGGLNRILTLFPSIMLPMFLAIMDQTIVSAALPSIAGELGDAERISWVIVAYLIAATIASPVYGRLGDVLGRKRLMFVALVIVATATLICGLAVSVNMLILARILQGFGGGGLMTLSQALIGEAIPPRERARYTGFLASVAVFATGFGAVAGGFLTQHLGWRSVFFVSAPVGLIAMLLLRRLPASERSGAPFRFDAPGLLLFVVFITSSLVMLRQVQDFTAEVILPSLALLALAIVAIVLLVRRERTAPDPLFPTAVFRDPTIWRSDVLALCHGAALVSMVTFVPIYLRVGLGADAGQIGLALLPATAGVPIGGILTGQLVSRTGRTTIFPSVGLAVVVATLIGIGVWLPHIGPGWFVVLLGFTAIFMGSVMGVVQIMVQVAAGKAMLGTGAASVQFSRTTGAAVGTALVSTVLFATLTATDTEAAHMFTAILQQGPEVLAALPDARQTLIRSEIAGAFRVAFLTIAGFAAIGMVIVWTIPLRRIQ